ncbi:pyridoxal phosphate-dependent transferase [Rhodofomes roseus]|uniref:Pyridoxal phosphate-dependent transferase n=1 Tax=Rhodofomes roseus TaxID=34475 RepID=A0ABQ8KS89_9APHY|nr:pyridoxal phosphate-dependent transferase [Rhodofomes roseus]KAH9841154.1 pyridoxal phosphate-dependent transferase [Rhodofomes roseus]
MDGSDYQGEQCPQFGRAMHPYFGLDPGFANLNHGALGSVPRPVARAYERLSEQVEANPDRFMWFEYWPKLDEVRASVAKLIGASPDECVFVPNVSHGVNTVLRNFAWNKGDFIMITNCSFDTISGAAHNISDMPPHPTVSEFPLHFPESYSSMSSRFRDHLRSLKVKQAQSDGDASKKIVVIMDSVPCAPAVLMPWKEMVQICKEEGAWSLVDAAHSIGQEIGLDVTKAAPDFWISSCCKWLYAKRPCAVLYVPKRNHHIIKTALPTSLFYQLMKPSGSTLVETFKWPGTSDMLTPLTIKSALSFRAFLGGEEKINAYCHQLALAGGRRMAEILGTSMMYSAEDEEGYNLNMANVELPIPSTVHMSLELMHTFQDKLINEHNTYSTQFYHNNKWWTRPSANVFNEIEDFERLGRALVVVCKEITDKFGI